MQDAPLRTAAMESPFPWRKTCALFATLGVLVYAPALFSYFSSDDFLHLGRVIEGHLPFVPEGHTGGFLRPVIGASLWLEYHLWGLHPLGFHAANILVHVANSLLVTALARRLQPPAMRDSHFFPVASGLVFLLMACHAEPVSWISGRTDVFATCFMLLGLVWAAQGLETNALGHFAASLCAFAAALATKESALAFPAVLAVLAAQKRLRDRRALSAAARGWLVANLLLLGAYFLCRRAIIGAFIGGYGAHGHLRMNRDILAQATSRFAWRAFFPVMPESVAEWMAQRATLLGMLWVVFVLAVGALLLLRAWRRQRLGLAIVLFFAFWAALLPVINVRIQWTNPEGERFLYFASAFAAMALVHAIGKIPATRFRVLLVGAVLITQGSLLFAAVWNWQAAGAIARSVVEGLQTQYTGGRLILVNKPDSRAGALVLRTGLPEGLRYFGNHPRPEADVEVLYAVTVFQRSHGFALSPVPNLGSEVYRIRATDPTSVLSEEDRGDWIETLETDHHDCIFRFREPLRDVPLFYYDSRHVAILRP